MRCSPISARQARNARSTSWQESPGRPPPSGGVAAAGIRRPATRGRQACSAPGRSGSATRCSRGVKPAVRHPCSNLGALVRRPGRADPAPAVQDRKRQHPTMIHGQTAREERRAARCIALPSPTRSAIPYCSDDRTGALSPASRIPFRHLVQPLSALASRWTPSRSSPTSPAAANDSRKYAPGGSAEK